MKVAVGVIRDAENRYLITQRSMQTTHGGYWEFPGGKLEQGEDGLSALTREIAEEVGLSVLSSQFLGKIEHAYPGRQVELLVYLIEAYSGTADRLEGQMDLRWVPIEEMSSYRFPEANHKILQLLS